MLANKTKRAPPNSGKVILGRTLPSLLDEACGRSPNSHALNQWVETGWQSLSNQDFRTTARELAQGLLSLQHQPGDRVALLMHSDISFCIADMGTLLAGLVNVPIDLTQTIEHIIFILKHGSVKTLIISNLDFLNRLVPYLVNVPSLKTVIVASELDSYSVETLQVFSLNQIRTLGRNLELPQLGANDLATVIYIPGVSGEPQGVMLTHENISANAVAMFSGISELEFGEKEVILSFLPLTHVFARTFLYGHLYYGHSIYFSHPNRVLRHLKDVQPTIFVTVPLLLEKIYSKILEEANKYRGGGKRQNFSNSVMKWALNLAQQYQLGRQPQGRYALMLKLADRLVFKQWRCVFGDRLKYLICGGAALKTEIANLFAAASITVLQGYGLTETSGAIACNRGKFNRGGTVGLPIAGVEVAIASDGEILTKSPYITQGYYKNPAATQQLIDADGWLHTGDLGEFTKEGFLKITGLKKSRFKLLTGKYVTPQPLETKLERSPLVTKAVTVGVSRKFCAMLIFANIENLRQYALSMDIDLPTEALLHHPDIIALYQALIDEANCHLPYWSTVKRFQLINSSLMVEQDIQGVFAQEIDAMYQEQTKTIDRRIEVSCPATAISFNL